MSRAVQIVTPHASGDVSIQGWLVPDEVADAIRDNLIAAGFPQTGDALIPEGNLDTVLKVRDHLIGDIG